MQIQTTSQQFWLRLTVAIALPFPAYLLRLFGCLPNRCARHDYTPVHQIICK
jgi:hypothetical protein